MQKTLLLDIDYTIMYEKIPRPYLKEFLERMILKYEGRVYFYTAGTALRVLDVLRLMQHEYGFDRELIRTIQRKSLTRDNCKTIELKSGATVKCMQKAADILGVDVESLILLDDNPKYDNPHEHLIVQAHGFMGEQDDNYLLTLDI